MLSAASLRTALHVLLSKFFSKSQYMLLFYRSICGKPERHNPITLRTGAGGGGKPERHNSTTLSTCAGGGD
jgi:hypothetical protein